VRLWQRTAFREAGLHNGSLSEGLGTIAQRGLDRFPLLDFFPFAGRVPLGPCLAMLFLALFLPPFRACLPPFRPFLPCRALRSSRRFWISSTRRRNRPMRPGGRPVMDTLRTW
jgi:hypothetical protein